MIKEVYNYLTEFNTVSAIFRLILATVLGGCIGIERGKHGRPAGLRTHILICVGAAMSSVTSMYLCESLGYSGDVARLSAQVISGIGFLGAGTIMIRNSSVVTGLTTAAGMWATAAIGIAAGYGFYVGAITATIIGIFSVTILTRLERSNKNVVNVYIELNNVSKTQRIIDIIFELDDSFATYDIVPPKSGQSGNVGIMLVLHGSKFFKELKNDISEKEYVVMILKNIGS